MSASEHELFVESAPCEEGVRPKRILEYKTYNKIPHLPSSRLGEGDHCVDINTESLLTKDCPNECLVIVQEKLDGSNVCVVRHKGKLFALSRSGYDCSNSNQEQHRMFAAYVKKYINKFSSIIINDGDRIVGEWLALAHGTIYEGIEEPFVPFDMYIDKKQLSYWEFLTKISRVELEPPALLHVGGACSIRRALKLLTKYSEWDDNEGVIYRLEENMIPKIMAKYVNHDKVDGKYLKDGIMPIYNWRQTK